MRAEPARHDWSALNCACGDSAEHVPLLFETLLTAESPEAAFGYGLSGHVVLQAAGPRERVRTEDLPFVRHCLMGHRWGPAVAGP
ncbi:hypothetical protein [Streptomyces sp. NPDC002463]|uniref:hypothetical protein n=1 Tax=Streptomyces sp. NPDC002463 TaxID=3364645 RepID=UPI0036A5FFCD